MDRDYFQQATQEAISSAQRITSRAITVAASGMLAVHVSSKITPTAVTAISTMLAVEEDLDLDGLQSANLVGEMMY